MEGCYFFCVFILPIFVCFSGDDYEEIDTEFGSATKKRRTSKTSKLRKSASSRSDYYFYIKYPFVDFIVHLKLGLLLYFSYYFLFGSRIIRVSTAVNTILQKLCTVLGLLKDLLLIERLSDSCILQLVKTSITTFLVDNIQLLQLKAIGLLCTVLIFLFILKTFMNVGFHECLGS